MFLSVIMLKLYLLSNAFAFEAGKNQRWPLV